MTVVEIIDRKRQGEELSSGEIEHLVLGFTRGTVPDYQMSAWLMAVVWRGMSDRETADLTMTMARSGEMLDLSGFGGVVVDKHSTGGVGDKTTLVVAPLVASLGLLVGKMSGRGLGFSGGTLDKLEAIPGFEVGLSRERFLRLLHDHGIVVAGQSAELAPADGRMYALRDVTATVASMPLIASSIMSKKIASGTQAIVLDVKVGHGAFMKTEPEARELAQIMVRLGRTVGRKMAAVVSSMDQPLGQAVGNALEVAESIETLRGLGPDDLREHCLAVAGEMIRLGGVCETAEEGQVLAAGALDDGRALAIFREWVEAQGGDPRVVDRPSLMPQAPVVLAVTAEQEAAIASIDAAEVGLTCVELGAGRQEKGMPIDPAVGVVFHHKVGDRVDVGADILEVHARDKVAAERARARLFDAIRWSTGEVAKLPVILGIIR